MAFAFSDGAALLAAPFDGSLPDRLRRSVREGSLVRHDSTAERK